MKIIFTKQAEDKFIQFDRLGRKISKKKIYVLLRNPDRKGKSRFGQQTVLALINKKHVLRVIYN